MITNLTDGQQYKHIELCKLYKKRWSVEKSFKHLKLRAELENLSGKSHIKKVCACKMVRVYESLTT